MSSSIKISKGLDIRLKGAAENTIDSKITADMYAVKPTDFHGVVPKMVKKEGESVQAGETVFFDKYNDAVKFVSPVSGTVDAIVRGAKRKILEVTIKADSQINYKTFTPKTGNKAEVIASLLETGLWPCVKQRPFDVVANPTDTPVAIFVSGFDSNPLAPSPAMVMEGNEDVFKTGMEAIVKMADGTPVYLGNKAGGKAWPSVSGVTANTISGSHPAGNVGVQIHAVKPINKGEIIWTITPQDIIIIGRLIAEGKVDMTKTIALTGSEMKSPRYAKVVSGASMKAVVNGGVEATGENAIRYVSGNALTGDNVGENGYLGFYHNQVTTLPEGTDAKFLLTNGWLGLGLDKFSASRVFPTWLMPKSKSFTLDTNNNGEERAFVMTGQYDKVFPFDILPVHLIKSVIIGDLEAMENLGIYEVAPEDFALCEYVCTSKIDVQSIIREGLDTVQREC